jgi:predicted NAD/FAD-binding protein
VDEIEQWRADRNKALMALDIEWARKMMPDARNDHVRLAAMHKGRYECTDLDNAARHTSGEWLRQHGYGRMTGEPLLQEGVLPA